MTLFLKVVVAKNIIKICPSYSSERQKKLLSGLLVLCLDVTPEALHVSAHSGVTISLQKALHKNTCVNLLGNHDFCMAMLLPVHINVWHVIGDKLPKAGNIEISIITTMSRWSVVRGEKYE